MIKVEAPVLQPGHCYTCGSGHASPSIDTEKDDGIRRVYVCQRCVEVMGQMFGMLSRVQADEMTGRLVSASDRIGELEDELVFERDNKTVSMADMRKLLNARTATATKKTRTAA